MRLFSLLILFGKAYCSHGFDPGFFFFFFFSLHMSYVAGIQGICFCPFPDLFEASLNLHFFWCSLQNDPSPCVSSLHQPPDVPVLLGTLPSFLFPGLFCISTPCSSHYSEEAEWRNVSILLSSAGH